MALAFARGSSALSTKSTLELETSDRPHKKEVKGLFRGKHLFVELHEFRGTEWEETHRWNHGLQEDLLAGKTHSSETPPGWTGPHLPSISLFGLSSLHTSLTEDLVILDLAPGCKETCLRAIVDAVLDRMVQVGKCPESLAGEAAENLHKHVETRKWARGKQFQDDADEAAVPQSSSAAKRKFKLGAVGHDGGAIDLEAQDLSNMMRQVSADDALRPNVEEESVQILIDNVTWLQEDVTCFVRLSEALETGLEECSRGCCPTTRFIILILGPLNETDEKVVNKKQVEMGEAAAALLQDDGVVQAVYRARQSKDVTQAIEHRLWNLRLMPNTTRPTAKALEKRATKMMESMETVRREEEQFRKKESTIEMLMSQNQRWLAKQHLFHLGGRLSVTRFLGIMQKLAVPLISGILLGLVWANTEYTSYDRWAGAGHGSGSGASGASSGDTSGASGASGDAYHPTMFDISVRGHPVTLLFLVNDIGMCFFFGLAAKEICEALQPGGSLYPPTRSTVNVLAATVGGVLGPIAVYMLLAGAVAALGWMEPGYGFADYASGWGIPTATDISLAWVTALVCFGRGHPAINYLLLLAIIDDGIGLLIIAFAYPDVSNPFRPEYLGFVVLAMVMAYLIRRLKCRWWQVYVFVAGPVSWFGLLYSGLHPALAFVFVVPFMPLEIKDDTMDITFMFRSMAATSVEEEGGHENQQHHHSSPLHDFEEATKTFVDFIVLFAFGCVNAGVQVGSVGALTGVVLLSLVVGKTAGITVASSIASQAGCPPPSGMNLGSVAGVGFIASAGLTVALFVAGEAFSQDPELDGQAKMGALLSISVAVVAVGAAKLGPSFGFHMQRTDSDPELQIRRQSSDFSEGDVVQNNSLKSWDSTWEDIKPRGEEPLERTVVEKTIKELVMMHKVTQAVETKFGMTQMEASAKAGKIYEKKSKMMSSNEQLEDKAELKVTEEAEEKVQPSPPQLEEVVQGIATGMSEDSRVLADTHEMVSV